MVNQPTTPPGADDLDVVLIGDPPVTDIPTAECGEPLIDVADAPSLRLDHRLADPSGHYRRLRSGLATRLVTAGSHLSGDVRICVIEGFRPRSLQTRYFNDYVARLTRQHPDWDTATLTRLATRHVAPPSSMSPHSTGGAVDLTLVDHRNRELDMGTQVNATPEESKGRCYTHAPALNPEAKRNRALLQQVLEAVGLINYPTEWWHWSYGDQYWALQTEAPTTRYREIAAADSRLCTTP